MIIHGLADDNVVVAHTLRLSSALLAAGRPHEVLPLSGVTHMTPQEQVAENLLLLQVDFLKRSLGLQWRSAARGALPGPAAGRYQPGGGDEAAAGPGGAVRPGEPRAARAAGRTPAAA